MKSKLLGLLLAGAAFAAFGLVGTMDYEDAVSEQKHYCEMVDEYNRTNGQAGWPDYEGTYTRYCN